MEVLLNTAQNETGTVIENSHTGTNEIPEEQVTTARLSPEGQSLFDRSLRIRNSIGVVPFDVADLLREMREQGD